MADDLLTFGGTQIGSLVTRFTCVPQRGTPPSIQAGVFRREGLLTDHSPNVLYELHVWVKFGGTDMYDFNLELASLADHFKAGLQSAVITDGSSSFTLPNAALLPPNPNNQAIPNRDLNLELVFVSVERPF